MAAPCSGTSICPPRSAHTALTAPAAATRPIHSAESTQQHPKAAPCTSTVQRHPAMATAKTYRQQHQHARSKVHRLLWPLFHTEAATHTSFYTHHPLLHTDAFTHSKLLHAEAVTHRKSLHTEAAAHANRSKVTLHNLEGSAHCHNVVSNNSIHTDLLTSTMTVMMSMMMVMMMMKKKKMLMITSTMTVLMSMMMVIMVMMMMNMMMNIMNEGASRAQASPAIPCTSEPKSRAQARRLPPQQHPKAHAAL